MKNYLAQSMTYSLASAALFSSISGMSIYNSISDFSEGKRVSGLFNAAIAGFCVASSIVSFINYNKLEQRLSEQESKEPTSP
ncbi:MAG: hypothetical protein KJ623_00355 [Nanoarchaeota archaeon]|nr:hypothetical protein [Nanoarchaeota archaeon]MBU0962428.1 hypothetical protein [Nanoarchaeota archaeon]